MAISEAAVPVMGAEGLMEVKPETMLVRQSRHVPIKSKKRALGRGFEVMEVDILTKI